MNNIAIVDPNSSTLPYDYYLIKELLKDNFVDFYCSKTNYNYEYLIELKKNTNIRIFEYKVSSSSINKFFGLLNYLLMLTNIFMNRKRYNKIHFQWIIFPLFEFPLFYFIKSKFIFTIHNDIPHGYKKATYLPFKIIKIFARKLIFVSAFTETRFEKNYGPSNKYVMIQHGIMPLELTDVLEESKKLERRLLFWGRVTPYKGIETFIETFDSSINIEIYGKWDNSLLDLKNKMLSHKNIFIYDKYLDLKKIKELLSTESVFVLPYSAGTQSGILYTLLAHERVFISSNVGENSHFLKKHGFERLIFDRADKKSIKDCINYAFNNYFNIKSKLHEIKDEYKWSSIITNSMINKIYYDN
jgi:glycosyltransferase involved in cell wall biosynthesis